MTNLSSVAVVIIGSSVHVGSLGQSRCALADEDWLSVDTLRSPDDAFDDTEQYEVMRTIHRVRATSLNATISAFSSLPCMPWMIS